MPGRLAIGRARHRTGRLLEIEPAPAIAAAWQPAIKHGPEEAVGVVGEDAVHDLSGHPAAQLAASVITQLLAMSTGQSTRLHISHGAIRSCWIGLSGARSLLLDGCYRYEREWPPAPAFCFEKQSEQ